MKTMKTDYVSPVAESVELLLEGAVMSVSGDEGYVGGGTGPGGLEGEE
ncbi:MAG: hypothetical protein IKY16_09385 [Bacteroidales bacterium]|jgi:hypothetical protein|nr:hypothetical protein [Bacteroidales bacterium]